MYTGALTSLMAKEPITTRLDTDTKTEVDNYADDHDIGQTEATRRLIRAGLAAEGHPVATADGGAEPGPLERLATQRTTTLGVLLFGLSIIPLLAATTAGTTTTALLAVGVALIPMGLGAATIWTAALAQLALARPLRALVLPQESTA